MIQFNKVALFEYNAIVGNYKFTYKDKEEIKKQLLLLSDEIKLFAEKLNL